MGDWALNDLRKNTMILRLILAGLLASVSLTTPGAGYLPNAGPATLRFQVPVPPGAPLPPLPPQPAVRGPVPSPAAPGNPTHAVPEGPVKPPALVVKGVPQAGSGAAGEDLVEPSQDASDGGAQALEGPRIDFVTPQHLIPFFTEGDGWKAGALTVAPVSFVPPHPAASKATYHRVP
jgi:hypothetical protein